MELNTDFSKRVAVHSADEPWAASPIAGVDRRMLDRIGGEVARATTIVRFAPDSAFSPHVHTGGEEFFVLEGVFQDEHGDFPAGSYIRNPPESSHTPSTAPGCVIFVKLWQFDMADRTHMRVDTNKMRFVRLTDEIEVMPLFSDGQEDVALERWAPNADVHLEAPNGAELLVLDGGFDESGENFRPQSWLRLPKGGSTSLKAGENGARVWIKRNHLAQEPQAPVV
ncbi:ChrR Cupin-like domain protein [Roseovarius albus]|uniref:ChrR Cupin-like domain protein n=1 Tax=Roseovarius albus TaxID=1247867 RepID=A0A1X6ZFK7_9RHOB|nr:cupin domain-containing protein [Roseovarius albus]SLN50274.1 ChrR Cupin-like domain protein [Roseovarius albus]